MTPFAYVGDYCPVCVVCCQPRGEGTGLHCDQHHRAWKDRYVQSCTPAARAARSQAHTLAIRKRAMTFGRVCHAG